MAYDNDFMEVLKDNRKIIFKVINIYCKDELDKADLEQEIIIQLWKSFRNYDDSFKISTWMYRIAMNVAITFYRTESKRKAITIPISDSIFENFADHTHEERSENSAFLHAFIDQQDAFDKQILLLYLEDFSYKEISEIVGLSESNVGTKINRLKTKLKTTKQWN